MLGALERFEVEGRRPVCRSRKMWRRCVQEDMALMGLDDHQAKDRATKCSTAQEKRMWMRNEMMMMVNNVIS